VQLSGVVEEQSQKLNSRVTQLAGVVSSNKADQAHLNAQVNAELKRRQKVGSLHTTVKKLAKKHNRKALDLAGIVEENAIKDAAGRANLKKIQKANYDGIKSCEH